MSHQSKIEQDIEKSLRKAFEEMPLIMLEDQASLYKNITIRVCDEYIEKGREFKKQWALKTVREMFGSEIPSFGKKEDDTE